MFSVYSNNQIECRFVLTTGFMEKLKALKILFCAKHISLYINGQNIYIAVDIGRDSFNIARLYKRTDDKEQFERMYNQFDFILKIEKIILTFFNFNFKNINFKDFTKFNKKINYLNIDDYLYQEVYNKKNLNVVNVISKYTNLNHSKIYNPKLSTTFLYWYELQNNVIPLISFDFMTNNMNENIQPFIKVRIYYTKMLMVFFNQKNINKIIE